MGDLLITTFLDIEHSFLQNVFLFAILYIYIYVEWPSR